MERLNSDAPVTVGNRGHASGQRQERTGTSLRPEAASVGVAGRFDRVIRAVLAASALAVLLAAGCAESEPRPRDISVAQLVGQEAAYDGDLVRTEGTVASFGEERALHYWIEDASSNRVGLVPDREAAPFLGHDVVVVGTFRFDERQGRRISVERIEPAGGGAS